MRSTRRRKTPYRSGYCLFPSARPAHGRCSGAVKNGAAVKNSHTVCACECHGDYETRLAEYGQAPAEEEPEPEEN